MRLQKKIGRVGEAAWILGVLLCSLGVCFSAKSGFGVSMVVAPAYVLYSKLSGTFSFLTFGMTEYLLQGLLIFLLCVVTRKCKWKYPLSFVTSVCYGFALDFWQMLFGKETYALLWQRCLSCGFGAVVTALAIALYLRTYLPQQGYELVVKELTETFHWKLEKVKWIYDLSSLLFSVLLMLLLFGTFSTDMIGIGTLLLAVINTPLIALWGKLLDRFFVFTSAFPRFYNGFERVLNGMFPKKEG